MRKRPPKNILLAGLMQHLQLESVIYDTQGCSPAIGFGKIQRKGLKEYTNCRLLRYLVFSYFHLDISSSSSPGLPDYILCTLLEFLILFTKKLNML